MYHQRQTRDRTYFYNLGRIATSQAETLDGIYPEQYEICKAKYADTQALNTKLFYKHIWQKRIPAKIILSGLVSNYELMFHRIVSLYLQRVNAPKDTILCTFTLLKNGLTQ